MTIRIGRFVLECGFTRLFIRVPYLGAAFIGGGLTAFDSWSTLRSLGEV